MCACINSFYLDKSYEIIRNDFYEIYISDPKRQNIL